MDHNPWPCAVTREPESTDTRTRSTDTARRRNTSAAGFTRVKPAALVLRLRAVSVLLVRVSVLSGSRVTAHGHGLWSIPGERVALLHQMHPVIDIPDSGVFRKKGGWVFSWIDAIQKKPQGMDISLLQNRAFLPESPYG